MNIYKTFTKLKAYNCSIEQLCNFYFYPQILLAAIANSLDNR